MSTSSYPTQKSSDNGTLGNYPPPDDTTSEGGYGGQSFAPVAQRGLIDQTTDGQPLGNELQDAVQGTDEPSQRQYKAEQKRQGQGLNPYGGDSFENREDAGARIASSVADTRARKFESGPAASNDQDAGAQ
ncbi:hypothetical protein DFH11DRAFT_1540069 [Phellopilus nigrolimitatus]|nr:hypothetical protein DFH11DRAFT_1540069 [Phellopilus nigrolimitatus]